jgi:hypothetical protein
MDDAAEGIVRAEHHHERLDAVGTGSLFPHRSCRIEDGAVRPGGLAAVEHDLPRDVVVVLDPLSERAVSGAPLEVLLDNAQVEELHIQQVGAVNGEVVVRSSRRCQLETAVATTLPIVLDPIHVFLEPATGTENLVPLEFLPDDLLQAADGALEIERQPSWAARRFIDRIPEIDL